VHRVTPIAKPDLESFLAASGQFSAWPPAVDLSNARTRIAVGEPERQRSWRTSGFPGRLTVTGWSSSNHEDSKINANATTRKLMNFPERSFTKLWRAHLRVN
jgi:hypothetical protein